MDGTWRRRLSRALTAVENRTPGWRETLAEASRGPTDALVVGITGPPGVGKSSLIDGMAAAWVAAGQRVGVLAIDPASPFSGGAVLGDRVRMRRAEASDAVYIRSMSARGHTGGLNAAARDLCAVMAGFGLDRIVLETVGVGQNEVHVAQVADCIVVVTVPGLGDALQAAKAGLMEIGDVYVVNKGDAPGAPTVAGDIVAMLALVFAGRPGASRSSAAMVQTFAPSEGRRALADRFGDPAGSGGFWHPPVVTTTATDDASVARLIDTVETSAAWLRDSGQLAARRARQAEEQLRGALAERLMERIERTALAATGASYASWIEQIARGQMTAHDAADRLLAPQTRDMGASA